MPTRAFPPVDVRLTPKTRPAAADTKMETTRLKPYHKSKSMSMSMSKSKGKGKSKSMSKRMSRVRV